MYLSIQVVHLSNALAISLNMQAVQLNNALSHAIKYELSTSAMHYYIQLKPTSICNYEVHVSKTYKHFIVHIKMPRNPLALIYPTSNFS